MATAIELALQRAVEKHVTAHAAPPAALRTVVEDWSRDDTVHTDPPLPPAPAPQPEKEPPVTSFDTTAPETMAPTGEVPSTRHFNLPDPAYVGVTQACFIAVRDNQGAKRTELIEAMIERGYKRGSVSSLMGAMAGRGILKVDRSGNIWAMRKKFKPLSSPEVYKREMQEKRTKVSKVLDDLKRERNGMSQQESGRIGGLASGKVRGKTGKTNGTVLPPPPIPISGGTLSPHGALVPDIGRPLTKEESGRLANLVRWNSWDKIADMYGQDFADAKREQFMQRHGKDYVPKLGGRAAKRVKDTGVDIDAAHKTARVVETFPNPAPVPPSAVVKPLDEAARRPDPTLHETLRKVSAAELIDALSLGQAREVYRRLQAYFKD